MHGLGKLTLAGNDTYTGSTTLALGILSVGSAGALGGGGVLSFAGGVLGYTASNQTDYSNRFSTAANQAYSIDTNGQNVTLASNLTSSGGSLSKVGGGTLTLTGNNTYNGATMINAGTLLAGNTSGSATGTGAVKVTNAGSVLGGTGTVAGAVTVNSGAAVLGGNGTDPSGTLKLARALTLNTDSLIELVVGANGTHSTLASGGSGTWMFSANQAFTLVDAGAQTGSYDNIITGLSADPSGESSWTITGTQFRGSFAYDGAGDIDLTLTAVPEPATWLAGGLTVLLGVGRWHRRLRRA